MAPKTSKRAARAASGRKMTVKQAINSNFDRFLKDPDFKKAEPKLKKRVLHADFEKLKRDYAKFIEFYVYRRKMKRAKMTRGVLTPKQERSVVQQGKSSLATYKDMLKTLDRIDKQFRTSKMDRSIEKHMARVTKYFYYNPKRKMILKEFRSMGVPRDAVDWLDHDLREKKYNVFRYNKAGGTFSGLVRNAKSIQPKLNRSVAFTQRHGLPIFEGAGDDKDEYVAAGTAIAVAIIVGLIFGFCYEWPDHIKGVKWDFNV